MRGCRQIEVQQRGGCMEMGMVGLGRMGANMARRLHQGGHRVVGYDPGPSAREALQASGLEAVASLAELVAALPSPRVVWLMVPAGTAVDATLDVLRPLLQPGDTVVDGGNSHYPDSQRRSALCHQEGIDFLDCGTSGGVWGLQEGYSLMVGGDAAAAERLRPLFQALAPAPDQGWGHVGPSGAGHFAKMVHNGIEYGMMQAYAEGFAIMQRKDALALDLAQLAQIWRHGSVVRSWLLDLGAEALAANPDLEGIAPFVPDSGEGRWTVAEAIDLDVSAPVITLSLLERLRSREKDSFADKMLAALRDGFGGHGVRRA
jgi:6-phosphogluconate dehydrogenase